MSNPTAKMYDVFINVFSGELQTSEIVRIMATDDEDATQMALEWETYVSEEDIAHQLANPVVEDNGDEFQLYDHCYEIGYIVSNIVELQEIPVQILRPLGVNNQLKPIYVPRFEQTDLGIKAHYYR